jgi:RHS repeat-associated protein
VPAGNCTNAQETYTYNNRLQPWMIELGKPGGGSNTYASYCLVYNYFSTWTPPSSCPDPSTVPTTGTGNNGNVVGYWYNDSVQTSFSHTASYTYDNVNRLTGATATGNATYSQIYDYKLGDGSNGQYGNMTCTTGCTPANWTLDPGSNHLTPPSSYTYDAAGNLTKDSSNPTVHNYQWDAEGRVSSVDNGSTWSFTYNAVGDRVQWAYPGGANQQMFDPNGGWLGVYGALDVLRWGDGAYAWYTGTETYFNHINNISTTSMLTNHSGAAVQDILYYPWGQMPPWHLWGGGGANYAELPYQDPNTSTNIAMFRFHSPAVGRWLSPDPVAGDITNPQSLNRYAYVLNNPASLTDPMGLGPCIYGVDQWTGKNCNPQRAAQSNLPGQWQDLFGFGSGIMNWDSFYFLTINSTPPPGWVPDDYQSTCPGCYVPPNDSDLVWNPANYQSLLGLLGGGSSIRALPLQLKKKSKPRLPTYWQSVVMRASCWAGQQAQNLAPESSPQPQDSTDSPEGTGGPNPLNGPKGSLNPNGSNPETPLLLFNFVGYFADVFACIGAVWSMFR